MVRNRLIDIIGIPGFTILLFLFESSDPRYYALELGWSLCISMLLWFGNGCLIRYLDKQIPWRAPAGSRLFIQLGLSTILTAWVTYFALQGLYAWVYDAHFSNLIFRRGLFLFLILSWLYNAIYTGHHFFMQWRNSIIETEELKRQNLISQYESLKAQINPHFLFNSINTIIGLIDEDPQVAKEQGHYFAKVYRYILDKGNQETISLDEEVAIIRIQQKLIEARFGSRIQIKINVNPNLVNRKIPPLALQMLVDNAIKHNVATEKNPLTIHIETNDEGYLRVSNNLQRKNNNSSTHLGMNNLIKRYELLTKKPVIIYNEGRYEVRIPLLDNVLQEKQI